MLKKPIRDNITAAVHRDDWVNMARDNDVQANEVKRWHPAAQRNVPYQLCSPSCDNHNCNTTKAIQSGLCIFYLDHN